MYFKWDQKVVKDLSDSNIEKLYDMGYVFTRLGKGSINQTRSLRIDLEKFELSSENKRVLKKVDGVEMTAESLPMEKYSWEIGKIGKDFYDKKFGEKTFSANKIKELLTSDKSNFNALLSFSKSNNRSANTNDTKTNTEHSDIRKNVRMLVMELGRCVCYAGENIFHYSYPFYDLEKAPKDMGMGMMLSAIMFAKEQGDKYIYIGSASRPADTYKLQFKGLEYYNGKEWSSDLEKLKNILKK